MALAGVYNGWETFYNLMYLDVASDNGYNCFSGRGVEFIAIGEVTPSAAVGSNISAGFYSYGSIRRANYFLQKVDLVPDMDETRRKIYKAEFRFLRAYDYYRKAIWFGGVPLVTKVIANPAEAHVARSSEADIVNFVLTELAEVAQILPDKTTAAAKGHVTKGAALALKARLELYKGKYTEDMADAKAIMSL